jgi:hypothetical protein
VLIGIFIIVIRKVITINTLLMNETVNYEHNMENDQVKHIFNTSFHKFYNNPFKTGHENNWNVRFRV